MCVQLGLGKMVFKFGKSWDGRGGGGGGNILTIFSELTQKSNKMCVQETLDTKKKEAREELQHWEDYLKKVSFATGCFMPSQQ